MGSNLSPTTIDIVFQYYEGIIMEPSLDVITYNRFADDIKKRNF